MFVFSSIFSETMRLDSGLIIELWNKGMLWDKLIGTHWLPLMGVKHSNQVRMMILFFNPLLGHDFFICWITFHFQEF